MGLAAVSTFMGLPRRHLPLILIALLAGFLAGGAGRPSPIGDEDNQGGFALALLLFVALLRVVVPRLIQSIFPRR